jgi:hypothetical protein
VSKDPPSLRDRVIVASERLVGASERTHFVSLLRDARAYRLDEGAAAAVARTVRLGMADVEANIDLVPLDAKGIWIEYPDAARRLAGAAPEPGTKHPCDVGVLVSVDPDNPDRYAIMTAWDFAPAEAFHPRNAASVRHGYAAVALSRTHAMHHAYAARNGLLGEEPPFERLLGLLNAYIPPGLRDEMQIAGSVGTDEEAEELDRLAVRDVMTEAPYALAALLLLSSLGRAAPGTEGLVALPPPRRFDGIRRWLSGTGFSSTGRPDPLRTRVRYAPPPLPVTIVA